MNPIRTTLIACLLTVGASAQTITNVTFSPGSVHECQLLNITIYGVYPSAGYASTFFTFDTLGHVMTLNFYGDGTGSNPPTPFSEPLPAVGPFFAGSYPFVATLYLNNVVADTWTSTVIVLPELPHNPGTDSYDTLCTTGPNIALLSLMDGSPSPGGQWIDPFGNNHSPTFHPGVDPGGVWLYSFDLTPPCPDTSAQLFVNYYPNNSSGTSGSLTTCNTGDPVDLFTSLGGTPTPGGTWTGPGAVPLPGGLYDADVNSAGVYTYAVSGLPPCGGPSSTITVSEAQPPNAGTGGPGEVCSNDSSTILNVFLSGNPQTDGFWYDPSSLTFGAYGAVFNAIYDLVGDYHYVATNAYCPADTATVTVVLVAPCVDTTGVAELDANLARFQLIPNPSDGRVDIALEVQRMTGAYQLEVLNAQGVLVRNEQLVFTGGLALRRSLDLSALAKGAYLLRVISPSGDSTARRLMLR